MQTQARLADSDKSGETRSDHGTARTQSTRTATARRDAVGQEALAELYRLHGNYLLRALMKMTHGDRGRAEDILQETFLKAWQHLDELSWGAESSRPWLVTVARRIAIDTVRKQAVRVKEVDYDPGIEQRLADRDEYDEVVAACDIGEALAELPAHQRDVLVQLHLKGRSVAEAAKALGIPPGTVKSRNYYAVRALRPVLALRGIAAAT